MNTPQVLDRDGAVLEVGSRVQSSRGDGEVGQFLWAGCPLVPRVLVRLDKGHSVLFYPDSKRRCPDLLITNAKENQ